MLICGNKNSWALTGFQPHRFIPYSHELPIRSWLGTLVHVYLTPELWLVEGTPSWRLWSVCRCRWRKNVLNFALILEASTRGVTHQPHNRWCREKASSILLCTWKENQKYLVNSTNDYYNLYSLKIVKTCKANAVHKSMCQSRKLFRWANSAS